LRQLPLTPEKVIASFDHYLTHEGTQIARANAEERMLAKLTRSLTDDIAPLLSADVVYRDAEAQEAFERVWFRLIARLSGDAWHRSEPVIEELRATSVPNLTCGADRAPDLVCIRDRFGPWIELCSVRQCARITARARRHHALP